MASETEVIEIEGPPKIRATVENDAGATLMQIVGNAVEASQPIEVIERLLVVHERIEAEKARKEYNAAMAALRGELPAIVKSETVDYKAKGGTVHYRHENLANIVEDLGPVMARHGLSFRWGIDSSPQSIKVTCIVTHAAGHSEEVTLAGAPDTSGSKNSIQAIASTVSYLQRYTIKAALGMAAGKDDDGQGGAPSTPSSSGQHEPVREPQAKSQGKKSKPRPAAKPGVDAVEVAELHEARSMFSGDEVITANQIGRLRNLAGKNGWSPDAIDDTLAQKLSVKADEIPALGDGYEAIVSWFQRNAPAA